MTVHPGPQYARTWPVDPDTRKGTMNAEHTPDPADVVDDPFLTMLLNLGFEGHEATTMSAEQADMVDEMSRQFGWQQHVTAGVVLAAMRGEYDPIGQLLPGVTYDAVLRDARSLSGKREPSAHDKALATHRVLLRQFARGSHYQPDLDDIVTSDALDEPQDHHPRGTYEHYRAEADKLLTIAAGIDHRDTKAEYLMAASINAQLAAAAATHRHTLVLLGQVAIRDLSDDQLVDAVGAALREAERAQDDPHV
jgi:hypothetical protein